MVLTVDNLCKRYDAFEALRPISFTLEPGDVLGLIGPNGAGKTSMLRCLCGILRPTAGRIKVDGRDLEAEPARAKAALAFVPDDPQLFETLTVWEHLVFTAAAYRVVGFEPAAESLLEQYKLTPKRNDVAGDLSRGMRQKLAICCAELHDPKLLMLDEPLTGLDPLAIRTVKDSLRRRADAGAAVMISSHLLALVEGTCTKLLVLHKGQSLFFGPIDDARPALARHVDVETGDLTLEELFLAATADES